MKELLFLRVDVKKLSYNELSALLKTCEKTLKNYTWVIIPEEVEPILVGKDVKIVGVDDFKELEDWLKNNKGGEFCGKIPKVVR